MGDQAFRDDDPSVYKTHILYVVNGDANCDRLMQQLEAHPLGDEVFVQDALKIAHRPAWLDGVPILVVKQTKQAHKGRNIYDYLRAWKSDEFMPAGSTTGGFASYEDPENAVGVTDRKYASIYGNDMFSLDEEDGGRQAAQPDPNASERDRRRQTAASQSQLATQRLQEARDAMDRRLQSRAGGGGPTMGSVPRNAFAQQPQPQW
jgi:hypothetical protein